jgi:16S rRNA (uracil1498-N3)-methyltransferase
MHRFIVDAHAIAGERATLAAPQARQIAVVLRLAAGDRVTLVSDGVEHEVVLDAVTKREARGRVVSKREAANEPRIAVSVAIPLLRGERTAEVVEAVTQLGVVRIAPFASARSVVRALSEGKRERLERVARESAETARRGRVPVIEPLRDWRELIAALPLPLLIAWEGERERSLLEALVGLRALSVVIGPEGGLSEEEIIVARKRRALTVSLGPRNLRSETAAIAAVAQTMAMLER